MDTVVFSPHNSDVPRLLPGWDEKGAGQRRRRAGMLSLLLHAALLAGLALMPRSLLEPVHVALRTVTPLIAPPLDITQPVPNKGPLSKEVTAEALVPRPRIAIPPSPLSTTRPAAERLSLPSPPPAPPPSIAEPPRLEAQLQPPPNLARPLLQAPPRIELQEKPKLVLETPGGAGPPSGEPTGRIPIPGARVQDSLRSLAAGGIGGGLAVGDVGEPGIGGIGLGLNLPPSPGRQASNLELLSDPMGVDFRPYLIQILATVRRNWFAVIPESARLGLRGRVAIQFVIARNGSVPKLVIVGRSGIEAFDRAAVAGISASNPFPPLPVEFKGDQVRLQFNFAYNIPKN